MYRTYQAGGCARRPADTCCPPRFSHVSVEISYWTSLHVGLVELLSHAGGGGLTVGGVDEANIMESAAGKKCGIICFNWQYLCCPAKRRVLSKNVFHIEICQHQSSDCFRIGETEGCINQLADALRSNSTLQKLDLQVWRVKDCCWCQLIG